MMVLFVLRVVLIALFFIGLWIPPLVTLTSPIEEVSTVERRQLAPLPAIDAGDLASFPAAFEAFYNDHFGLRAPLVERFNLLQVSLLGTSTSDRVIVGADGWLFQNHPMHVRDMRNLWPFSEGELGHWANILSAKYQWCRDHGIVYAFVLTPSKHLIYPEKLPSAFQPVNPDSRADQLVDYLVRHTEVPIIDLRPSLLRKKELLRPYHKTDTHWNEYGGFVGYYDIVQYLKEHLSDIHIIRMNHTHFAMVEGPSGDLAAALNLQNRIIEEKPVPTKVELSCITNSTIAGEDGPAARNQQWFSTQCEGRDNRLLMFRDSYSLALMPYLSESFAYVYYVPHSPVKLEDFKRIATEQKPDVIIEQRTTRWLRTPEG
jgi:alginate O-acetyltransferase complex protein AlgJ